MKNRLLKLLNDNRLVKDGRRFEVVSAKASKEATIYLYDVIVSSNLEAEFFGGVSAEKFNKELASIDAPVINIRINSPGGDVFAARAMETAIQNKRATGTKVVCYVDGYAASAATFVAMAASEVEISDGGFMMIHQAWTLAYGNADDLVSTAALLEQIDNTIVATYAKRTGIADDKLRAMIKSETWLNAQDAVDLKFADRVGETQVENRIEWKVDAYEAAPALHEGQDPATPTAPVPADAPATKPEVEEAVACVMSYDDAARRLRYFDTIAA